MAQYTDSPRLSEQFGKALAFVNYYHRRQTRKDANETPYIVHLLRVSAKVLELGGSETTAVAALLHDILEDTECGKELVQRTFGDRILGIVQELSEDKNTPKEKRKEIYAKSITNMSPEAALISFCDKLDNIESYTKSPNLFGESQKNFYRDLIPNYRKRGFNVQKMENLLLQLTVI